MSNQGNLGKDVQKDKKDVIPNANRIDSNRKENDGADAHRTQQKQKLNVEESGNKGIGDNTPNVNNKHVNAHKTLQDSEGREQPLVRIGRVTMYLMRLIPI